jgi:cobaltochelatase CobN
MTGSGLYGELEELHRLVSEYEQIKIKDRAKAHALKHLIMTGIKKSNLDKGIKNINSMSFEELLREIHGRLSSIRNTQIQDGMHIFGQVPEAEKRVDFIYSILRYDTSGPSIRREVAKMLGYDLSELLSNQKKVDEKAKKSYGEILEEVDLLCKEIIKQVLMEVKNAQN